MRFGTKNERIFLCNRTDFLNPSRAGASLYFARHADARFSPESLARFDLALLGYGENMTNTRACKGCLHFYITYDANFPYGCRAHQFKSRRLPYIEVEAASQAPCMSREPIPLKSARPPQEHEL